MERVRLHHAPSTVLRTVGEIMVLALSLTNDLYLRRLRVLGAWWCLGSSSVEPELLIEYEAGAEKKAA